MCAHGQSPGENPMITEQMIRRVELGRARPCAPGRRARARGLLSPSKERTPPHVARARARARAPLEASAKTNLRTPGGLVIQPRPPLRGLRKLGRPGSQLQPAGAPRAGVRCHHGRAQHIHAHEAGAARVPVDPPTSLWLQTSPSGEESRT